MGRRILLIAGRSMGRAILLTAVRSMGRRAILLIVGLALAHHFEGLLNFVPAFAGITKLQEETHFDANLVQPFRGRVNISHLSIFVHGI